MRMRTVLVAALAVLALALGLTAQTSAAPPEQVVLDDFFPGYADVQDGLGVFVNIGRDNVCEWADAGFVGPPPVDQTVLVQLKETGQGAVVASAQADLSIELWRFDPDVPPLVDPCADTDAQDGPWATGTVHVKTNDNDFNASHTRTNSFGITGEGTVEDATGATWHISWNSRYQLTQGDEFVVRTEKFNLHPIG
jgi:hypothetical protein